MRKPIWIVVLLIYFAAPQITHATDWGFHLLHPTEIETVIEYKHSNVPMYVTIPMSIYSRNSQEWNHFFSLTHLHNIIPIVRFSTRFDQSAWIVPERRDFIEFSDWLRTLYWPGERIVILFNEPNHAAEWGGSVNPVDYAEKALFMARWLQTEPYPYKILPAGMDAAAPNREGFMDNLLFIRRMLEAEPELVDFIDGIAAHAYPNPGFSQPPYSLRDDGVTSFESELEIYEQYSGRKLDVYITETGWIDSQWIRRWIASYYAYLDDHVFSHDQVKAATVFLLRGHNGPFERFSLLDEEANPSPHMQAILKVIEDKASE